MARRIDRNLDPDARLSRRLLYHQALHDPRREPRNRLRWLKPLQSWQTQRLERSFARFLQDPARRPAASFFLSDVYGDRDFTQRDADIAKVMPMMQRLLPSALLATVTDGIELGALTHALDLRMAQALQRLAPRRRSLDEALYAQAYRDVGLPRLRARQIGLIDHVGQGLAAACRMPGVSMLLKLSRVPAKAAGLGELQVFLERGFAAFAGLDDAQAFLTDIRHHEAEAMERLFAGEADPFRVT
ncbi:FFLEELY motif protein [Thermomonas sp.]